MMEELLFDVRRVAAGEYERANKLHPLFHSLHEAYGVLTEEITEAKEAFAETERMFDRFFICMRKDNYSSANENLEYIKENALNCAAEMIQVAVMAQKSIDSNAVKEKIK
ncbi:hypothetical protein E4N71_12080 [Treponema vincentii]|uniref:hypothetical protein n=1 Tax=Treponema vincentii TaxID=69710 RepID=UPI003D8B371F